MPASRSRRFFCQALLEETGGEVLRWATIADVAKRLGMDEREAILLAGECAEADYVLPVSHTPKDLFCPLARLVGRQQRAPCLSDFARSAQLMAFGAASLVAILNTPRCHA